MERFWAKADKNGAPPPHCPELGPCWLWKEPLAITGYARFWLAGRRNVLAHRFALELQNGPLPKGAMVLHRCDVKSCVNPDHLMLGSAATNMADCAAKGRIPRGERHAAARLTEAAAREILYSSLGCGKLAAKFGVTISTVHAVRKRKTWKHVT